MGNYILELHNLTKRFPGVTALDQVQFQLKPGEIHALVGENGAGKSTLIKIITGVYQPDQGQILLNGEPVTFTGPINAQQAGIAAIYQDPTTFVELSIAENVFMGHPILHPKSKRINWQAMHNTTKKLLQELELDIDPDTPMKFLNVAERQLIEIAKALSLHSKILIMDEPTSALTIQETKRLFDIINRLRASGVAIVFISHRLDEVFELADRVTVLRDGKYIGTHNINEVTVDKVIQMMVGRPMHEMYPKTTIEPGPELFRVENLTRHGDFFNISFSLRRGEILGIAGLVGAGRTELAEAIFGITRFNQGTIWLDQKELKVRSPHDALSAGIAYLPEDRQRCGLVLPMNIASNVTLSILETFKYRLLNKPQECLIAQQFVDKLDIRTSGIMQLVRNLSGGNQQKVVLAKWMATKPRVLILDEPTKGIDVQAKTAVYGLINNLAAEGLGIILISSELPEVICMSDRILVMHEGEIAAEFERGQVTQEQILQAAIGRRQLEADVS